MTIKKIINKHMKQIFISIICILAFNFSLFSQNSIDSVLLQIERNNTTLSALQKRIEVDKIGNKTGIYIQNPEVEFGYLWGNPSEMGNRTDFSISQSFDFPQHTSIKSKLLISKMNKLSLSIKNN